MISDKLVPYCGNETLPMPVHLVTETFFSILGKRISLGQALQVP
jgi:hypothetical protein